MGCHPSLWILCLCVFFLIVQSRQRLGCMEEDRVALLDLKASSGALFPSWAKDRSCLNCCTWDGVSCSPTTGRVDSLFFIYVDAYFNASIFHPFKDLVNLQIVCSNGVEHQGFEKLSKLKNLQTLMLRECSLNSNFLASLGELTSLKELDLEGNHIGERSSAEISQGFEQLSKLNKLEYLLLQDNYLKGDILAYLSELTSLRSLNLDGNLLGEGSLSEILQGFEKLSKLRNLERLSLRDNSLKGNVLAYLSGLTSLKGLYLSGNLLGEGSLSAILQGTAKTFNLKSLDILDLQSNHLKTDVLELLSNLTSLTELNLGSNSLGYGSSAEIYQGFQKLSKLQKLENLNLSENGLKSNVLSCLSELKSLKQLDLGYNFMGKDEFLDGLSQGIKKLAKLNNLEYLNLANNDLRNKAIQHFTAFTSILVLNGNHITEVSGFCQVKKLQGIDLRQNNLKGNIPPCLNNLTSLEALDLSQNQLSGSIPPWLTSNMTSLKILDLSRNRLNGTIPPSFLYNLTSLQYLFLDDNQLEGTSWITSLFGQNFQLQFLGLSNCNLNTSTTKLLKFLYHQSHLRHVNISHNNLYGKFPVWLLKNNTMLEDLDLRNNSIDGHIQFPVSATSLFSIDVSNNHIEGHLQKNFGVVLRDAEYLNFSSNGLEGKIPTSLSNMLYLEILDLSNNNFAGEIPESLGFIVYIRYLLLSNNSLDGQISPYIFNRPFMEIIRLSHNHFTGPLPNNNIPSSFQPQVKTLDISHNRISGRIPTWIANFTWLQTLDMGENFFDGAIPLEVCNLGDLRFLDLSQNKFSGSIPSYLNLTSLKYLHLEGNKLSGSIPTAILRSSNLVTLDLNNNKLSGVIPVLLGSLQNLRLLLLKGNRLTGFLPHELCTLNKIGILDLSHNRFSGSVPACFSNITFAKSGGIEHYVEDLATSGVNIDGFKEFMDNESYSSYRMGIHLSQEEVEFITKGLSGSYRGAFLNYMSGMDLSCNKLTGHIPHELGALTAIHALNLSHNQFTGSIPKTFSKLNQLESMDLSHNHLSGEIPSELIDITTLEVFLVAYNNLSGRLPDMKAQFSTFTETSYEGNPFLCGPPLQTKCRDTASKTGSETPTAAGLSEKFGVDLISLRASSTAAYIMSLLALVIVLYINPYWRKLWFDCVDACLSFVFPFWSEAIYRVSNPFT